jgi:alpha-ketoglutarate-dependent taurine dioxygenase
MSKGASVTRCSRAVLKVHRSHADFFFLENPSFETIVLARISLNTEGRIVYESLHAAFQENVAGH